MNFHLKELDQKHTDELNFKLEDLGNVYKNREDQRKSENDIEIDHLNNKIKQAEKHIEEMKNIISDLELKLKKEKDNHDKLIENYETIQKNYKFKTTQLEEDEKLINSLRYYLKFTNREKVYMLEENHNMLSNSKNSFQETIENLLNKIKNLESEKNAVKSNSAKNEEFYKEENENLEKVFRDYKESQTKKYNQIIEENSFKRNQIDTLEASSKKLQNYVISLEGKLRESTNQNEILQQIVNNLKLKIKNYEELLDELEKKKFYTEKNLKKTKYEKSNANDLLVKILKTKLNSMRDNISSMKSLMTNEINLVKNDMIRKTGELVSSQFTNLKQNFDKELQKAREILQRENIKKLDDKDIYYSDEISKLTQKYDRKILDILRRNEILENEINKFKVI
jgi:N-terminal acetyltransferase B complex non-catalytic subunit